jgi:hypothetical protein
MIQVFNEQGQLMRTALNSSPAAGTYTVAVDLGELPSGLYYARLQNESRQQVKGMMKVR